jgi:membrane-associated phospholipid phosphatase
LLPALTRSAVEATDSDLPFRPQDFLIVVPNLLAAALLTYGKPPGWERACVTFLLLSVALVALRLLAWHSPSKPARWAASFFPVVAALAAYGQLGPLCDLVGRPLVDVQLQHLDQALFGMQPAVVLDRHLTPAASDVLMLAYVSYYLWPSLLGAVYLWYDGEAQFDRWALAVMVSLLLNYVLYLAVPAIGPRFAMADSFAHPVQGVIAAPLFQAFMRSPFTRDCFPSGHTALTLMVLIDSWRHARRFFWAVLPIGVLLIVATVALRFHYGVDLLAAVPLAYGSLWLADRVFPLAWRGIARRTRSA